MKALYLEINSCIDSECPYSHWEYNENGPDGYHCHHPDSTIGMIASDNETKAYEKKHGIPFPFSIPKGCPLKDYDVFFAAIKALKKDTI